MRELYKKTKALKYSCQTQGLRAEPSPPHHAVWPELSINLVVWKNKSLIVLEG